MQWGAMSLRDWMVLSRIQTGAVELGLGTLVAYLGGFPWYLLPLVAVMMVVAHAGAFSTNSIVDLKPRTLWGRTFAGDVNDPNKQDHPLVAGRMRVADAWMFALAMQTVFALWFISVAVSRGTYWTIVPLAAFILLGYYYDLAVKFSKGTGMLALPTGYAMFILALGGVWDGQQLWLLVAWVWAYIAFQLIAGEMKELHASGELNLLRDLGTYVEDDTLRLTLGAVVLAGTASALKLYTLLAFVPLGSKWWWVMLAVGMVVFTVYPTLLLRPGAYARGRRMAVMGGFEALSYLLLPVALLWALPPPLTVFLIVGPVVWFVGWNRLLYVAKGTSTSSLAPGV